MEPIYFSQLFFVTCQNRIGTKDDIIKQSKDCTNLHGKKKQNNFKLNYPIIAWKGFLYLLYEWYYSSILSRLSLNVLSVFLSNIFLSWLIQSQWTNAYVFWIFYFKHTFIFVLLQMTKSSFLAKNRIIWDSCFLVHIPE